MRHAPFSTPTWELSRWESGTVSDTSVCDSESVCVCVRERESVWVSGKEAREFVRVRVGVLTDSMPSGASGKVCVCIRKSASNDATGLVAVCCSA